jgi:hypothetical protein
MDIIIDISKVLLILKLDDTPHVAAEFLADTEKLRITKK